MLYRAMLAHFLLSVDTDVHTCDMYQDGKLLCEHTANRKTIMFLCCFIVFTFITLFCYFLMIFYFFMVALSFFLSSPNLSGRRLDVCHTSTHGVALV